MLYIFGTYVVDTQRAVLTRDRVPMVLERQAWRVLVYLLQHRDRVVPNQELLAQLWDQRYVSRWVLPRCIRLLRQALGDTGRQHQYITTWRGHGYRFIASVEEHHTVQPDENTPAVTPSPAVRHEDWAGLLYPVEPLHGGEQRAVTVLACGVVEPTALIARVPPDTWPSLLEAIYTLAQRLVRQYGGTIQAFFDDGFMALFGVPVAQEEHAWQAVLAAIDLRQQLEETPVVGAHLPVQGLALRMGLHTGWVVGRRLEENHQETYLAVGDTFHLARQLQHHAAPHTILVSPGTARQTRGKVQLKALGPLRLSGATTAVRTYAVRGVARQRLSGAPPEGRLPSPFVGRAQERALLEARWRQAQHGHGQVVSLIGEAGMGKSRLIAELGQGWTEHAVTMLTGACQPYGQAIPYLPVCDLLQQYFGITPADPPDLVITTIQQAIRAAGLQADLLGAAFLALLGVSTGEPPPDGSPAVSKAQLFAALCHLFCTRAQRQPLVLVLEDLHWIDQASAEVCTALIDCLGDAPLLLLLTYRPAYQPPWRSASYITHLALPPLESQDSEMIVRAAAGALPMTEVMVQSIVTQAEGNPLFLEALTAAVADTGQLPAAAVPDTLQGVLLARIDRLPATPRQLLKTAAVLGRSAPLTLLDRLWQGAHPLTPLLQELQQRELLAVRPGTPEPVYVFKHALVQQAAYESLTPDHRQALHAAAGQALEECSAGQLETVYDRLAYHYAQTTEHARAVRYLTGAGEQALRSHAHAAAEAAFAQALARVEHLLPTERPQCRLDLVLRLTHAWSFLGRFAESRELLLQHQPQIEALQAPSLADPFYFRLGRTLSLLGDQRQASQYTQRALTAAQQCGDAATMGKAAYELGRELLLSAPPHQALAYGQQAITHLEQAEEQWWLGMTYWLVGIAYGLLGRFDRALAAAAHARALGEALQDPHIQSYAAFTTGWLQALRGRTRTGSAMCRRALVLSVDPVNTAHATGALGFALLEQGNASQALPLLEQAAHAWQRFQLRPMHGWMTTLWAQSHLMLGQLETADALAQEGWTLSREAQFPYALGLAQRLLGQLALARGTMDAAATHLTAARETFTVIEARFELGRTHLALATLAQAQEHRDDVAQHLTAAWTVFRTLRVPRYTARVMQRARTMGLALVADRQRG